MISLIQRVTRAEVHVAGHLVGRIGPGLLALVAVEKGDSEPEAARLAERLLNYRVFADAAGKPNLNLKETGGAILLVSQFTLAADTRKGLRPSFSPAADPIKGRYLFDYLVDRVRQRHPRTATGEYGADMQVSLVNDGPVTFLLRVPPVTD